ncbi:MAG: TonB-dependent receptor [Ferruginibacter sp.]|uniref:TonB-dependent receptor family protein n=1 Tax=Ferruginibacter sp. TaxID=1940288 RepID=UPI0026587AF8|nr:TonB-dependent receptor [Ferruginibacter sp.]MDB5276875.1 TonB-dependent receptor [Ferruginibacter sp.]
MNHACNQLLVIFLLTFFITVQSKAQVEDTTAVTDLKDLKVVGYKTINGIGHLNEVHGPVIYAGKKTEVIEVDSLDANKAINNTRQILGRIPGLYIVESETGGFVANGIGVRGLNPVQSLEMNVRQNGYNVAADVYGYNETYYLPPMEAVSRVEIIKGASAIQFGSQLGGMVNYVLKEGSINKTVNYSTMQTAGSDGLFNSYHAAGGTINKWSYFTFLNYRTMGGWRPNSEQKQLTGYGKINYQPSEKITFGLEYSLLRNRIKMPGGLTDDQFETDSKTSVRSRNWLRSPWNVLTASMDYQIRPTTSLQIKSTYLAGERSLVWFNKLPGEADIIDPATGNYSDREIDREIMKSSATEIRLLHNFIVGKMESTLATGIRFARASFHRNEEAPGTNKSNFDLSTTGEFEENFHFTTTNIAAFAENTLKLNNRLSITPGMRFESLGSEAEAEIEVNGVEKETETEKERGFLLMALGLQYKAGKNSNLYGNISQAYRPVDYAQLVPLGSVSKVDPNMKDPKGWNADLGVRGNVGNYFNYDISLFYLSYSNRIGLVNMKDETGADYTLRTNTDKSIHTGVESYVELNITRALAINKTAGELRVYNSFAYTRARYTKGIYKGNQVEYAPEVINRIGINYAKKAFSTSFQFSNQSKAFGDAANTERSSNPIIGRIPGYSIMDWSATVSIKKFKFKGGVNNLADKRYFTQRTDEYPGPGIIPSVGRSFYAGIGYNL